MSPIVTSLLGNGLSLTANAVLAKGTAFVKENTGIDLEKPQLSDKDLTDLKKFEMEHEEDLMKLRLEQNKLDIGPTKHDLPDTQGAREREAGIAQSANASWLNRNTGPLLALLAIFVAFGLFYKVTFSDILTSPNIANKDILLYILGVLSAIVTQVFSYYFGSSSGSKQKSEQIERMLEQKAGGKS